MLGRIAPPDFEHVAKYPLRALAAPPVVCERRIPFASNWRVFYNQGQTSECVAFSSSEERSLATRGTFDPNWLYARCKERDGMPNQDGTLIRVAYGCVARTRSQTDPCRRSRSEQGRRAQ